ncbi:hypothetical protein [Streptomyces sp. NPDC046821]
MAALHESVQKAKASLGESTGDATVHDMPKKKATARKPKRSA